MPICKQCGKSFPAKIVIEGKQRNLQHRKYCFDCSPFGQHNTRVFGKEHAPRKQYKCKPGQSVEWRKNLKLKAIAYKGGKCQVCGYDRCSNALEFHHLDPTLKSFGIGSSHFGWVRLVPELDKCILLCSNCHRELESGTLILNMEAIVQR